MRKMIAMLAAGLVLAAVPVSAALPIGRTAPDFRTMGALNGKPFRLHLAEQLKSGPVVLYFYPKAFTKGCTFEARAFSEASPQFAAAGARVILVPSARTSSEDLEAAPVVASSVDEAVAIALGEAA